MKRQKYYYKKQLKPVIKKFYYVKITKFLINNNFVSPFFLRQICMNKLIMCNKFTNFNKFRQFCLISGRTRFILKNAKISRMFFKKNVSNGLVVGTFKLS
jgi:ribosomal protein S14